MIGLNIPLLGDDKKDEEKLLEQVQQEAAAQGQIVPQQSSQNGVVQPADQIDPNQIEDVLPGDNYKQIGDLLNEIVFIALRRGASDIHIEPKANFILLRFRMDGILRDVDKLDKKYEQALIFKIKVNSKLRTDEHFKPQDGRISFEFEGEKLDTRISIIPTTTGEKVVIRILTQKGRSFELKELGMRDRDLEVIEKNYMKPYGTIISAGPTGSGKTTSLYSILRVINSREKNITTIEDPVEYEIEGVNHIQINSKAGLTFKSGLRSLLRQDPDVLMVGEIRDVETAEIAINAALTGHLVLSTIHTNDSVGTVPRLIDMGVEPFLVASAMSVVMAQRLARKLCDKCKQPYKLTVEEHTSLKKFRPDLFQILKVGETLYKEGMCADCKTGFKGRIGLFEVFEITEPVRKAITTGNDTDIIFKLAREQGLTLIVEDGVLKMREGLLSMSELLRVTALKQ